MSIIIRYFVSDVNKTSLTLISQDFYAEPARSPLLTELTTANAIDLDMSQNG